MSASLITLEGDHSRDGLFIFPHEVESGYTLLGDSNSNKRFKVSLDGDYIEEQYYSPLYNTYKPNNDGILKPKETWIKGNNGFYWHSDEAGNLLGCSVCIADQTLAGEDVDAYYHFNLDGTLAGYSIPSEDGKIVTLAGVDELGFSFKGFKGLKMPSFKMPSFKANFKLPKISLPKFKIPKISIPKFNIPKIKIPKISIPKFKVPDIGKHLSNVTSKIGKAVDTHARKIGEAVNAAGNIVSDIAQGAAGLVTGLTSSFMPGGGGMQEEGYPEEEQQPTDYTQPGYEDEQGYTASDGNYYLHDGSQYLNNQTGQWESMNQAPTDYTQPGYEDEQGYTASDGNYYLHDGSQYLNNQTGEWVSMAEVLYGVELGFDLSSISSLISNPMVSAGLNAVVPGAGMALPMLSNFLPGGASQAQQVRQPSTYRPTSIKPPPVRQTSQVTIKPPPVRSSSSLTANNTRSLLDMMPGWQGMVPPLQPAPQPPAPKEDSTKLLMIGGGIAALGLIYMMNQKKSRR